MSTYDLIGFDMDGTLLNSEKTISERTLDAVSRAAAAGKVVILTTGRGISELQQFESMLGSVSYYVCESGALVYDVKEKRVLHTVSFAREVVERVIELAEGEDVMPYMMSGGWAYTNREDVADAEHFHMGIYREMMKQIANLTDDLYALYRAEHFSVEKFNLFAASREIRERISARVQGMPLTTAYAEDTSLEMSPQNVSKASGLNWLCQYLNLPLEKTIVVGDADNDAEVLRVAGLSVAMGNALPHIKAICDVVVSDNDHDGCAEVVDRYLLE